ncbi:MAG: nucleotide exchange factor GrpE [Clostridiales Family XIII bacterium]|jgi:molecular chaperone GrpE|nr:nucleotide exchange factor GrpE [Clostridiales Family XIII bacterium]
MGTDSRTAPGGAAKKTAPRAADAKKAGGGAGDKELAGRTAPLQAADVADEAASKARDEDGRRPADAAETGAAETEADAAANGAAQGPPEGPPADGAESDARDEDLNAKYLRLAADFQNYRRRVEKEKSDIYAYANEKIVSGLLDVADSFERALEHDSDPPDEGFLKGMELIFRQLTDVLTKNGAEEIDCLGAEFDPSLHHAVMMEECAGCESGRVSEVLKKGYRLNDRLIRPAMVKVAK